MAGKATKSPSTKRPRGKVQKQVQDPSTLSNHLLNDPRTAVPMWADRMMFFRRADCEVAVLLFDAEMPELGTRVDVARISVSVPQAKRMAELLCQHLDHWPVKAAASKKP
jgi:hypothetical protein